MDKELLTEKFEEIEKKIERLIEVSNHLETTNVELREKNAALEEQLQELREAESRNNEIKTLIKSKIDSLMARLEGAPEE